MISKNSLKKRIKNCKVGPEGTIKKELTENALLQLGYLQSKV